MSGAEDHEIVSLLLLGKGTVGGQLLAQVAVGAAPLLARHDVDLRLVGMVDSRASVFTDGADGPSVVLERLRRATAREAPEVLLDQLRELPTPILVDCTASDGMGELYEAALSRGIHVVSANKKPFATGTADRDRLFASARRAQRSLRYETTVGASLPIIETLQNLVATGDEVRLVEGSFSGTLGFLSNEVSRGVRLSEAVREARARGYTEPHPRDDLSGTDVARKALILARELGLALDLDAIEIEPFVPRALSVPDRVEDFLTGLASYDDAFGAQVAAVRERGRVLRYLATIEPRRGAAPRVHVGPAFVPADHPAARLRGTEAFVAFHTARHGEVPIVVQGGGAGGAVTAAGVLADIIAIARGRRGR